MTTIKTNLGNVTEANKPEECKTDPELNKEWSYVVKTLTRKLFEELPSRPETEHLQSIAQSAFTGMLPHSSTSQAKKEIFAFAHSCCNAS